MLAGIVTEIGVEGIGEVYPTGVNPDKAGVAAAIE